MNSAESHIPEGCALFMTYSGRCIVLGRTGVRCVATVDVSARRPDGMPKTMDVDYEDGPVICQQQEGGLH